MYKKVNEILSSLKLGSIIIIGIISLNLIAGVDKIYYSFNSMIKFILVILAIILISGLYYIWSFILIKKIKASLDKILFIESIIFILFFMVVIMLTGVHQSPYKVIFLFIIIPISIQFDFKYGLISATICSLFLLSIDLIYGTNQPINTHLENDIIISSVFIVISWLLAHYVKIEKEHSKMLENIANTDRLTGLYNHRYFYDQLTKITNQYKKGINDISLIFVDIDYFKEYNDMFGHLSGDNVLRIIGETLSEIIDDEIGITTRYGGDEFAIIITNQTEREVYILSENIRNTLEKIEFTGQEHLSSKNLTVSIGIAMYNKDIRDYLELIKCADDALYRAKFIKKNRVEIYSSVFSMIKTDIKEEHIDLITSVKTLISVINAKDKYTYGHVERVVIYVKMLADELDLSDEDKNDLIYSAYMHDIGKINIPEDVLNKKMPLNKKELELIKQHPQNGVEIVNKVDALSNIAPLIKHHHERYDGLGYPDNLKGDAIPYLARILTIVDSFDAMTFSRPYKPAMTFAEAAEELKRCSGTQFDPHIAKIFISIINDFKNGVHTYVPYKHNDFLSENPNSKYNET